MKPTLFSFSIRAPPLRFADQFLVSGQQIIDKISDWRSLRHRKKLSTKTGLPVNDLYGPFRYRTT